MTALPNFPIESSESFLFDTRLLDPHHHGLQGELDDIRREQHSRVLKGLPVWDLSMVNPDINPPRSVLDRLLESVTKPANHRYAVSRGVRRLREAFAVKYGSRFGQVLHPESEVCVCLGSKDATFHALRVLVSPGDSVIVASPAYPAHPSAVALTGARSIPWNVPLDPEKAAKSLESLLQASGARVVLLNFPANPSGAVVSESWWLEIGAVCARRGACVINDFVYGEMCFSGEPAVSALTARRAGARCVEVYSLSKAYNVPGWRVGALVGDAEIVGAVSRLKAYADYGLFLPLQYAATMALTCSEDLVSPTVKIYERRLKVLTAGLRKLGCSVMTPEAGACLWVEYPESFIGASVPNGRQSTAVAQRLLSNAGIVVTPGVVFGRDFDHCVRVAAVTSEERLRDALEALEGLVTV